MGRIAEANTAMPATARAGDAEGAGPCAEVATKGGPTAAHDGEAWTGGAARPGAGAWAPLEGLRAGQKRPAACAELSILQEMSASAANVDWLSSRKTGSDAIAGRPGVGAGKRAKPAKGWGISLSVPAETPPVEVRPRSPRPQPLVSRAFVAATPRPLAPAVLRPCAPARRRAAPRGGVCLHSHADGPQAPGPLGRGHRVARELARNRLNAREMP